jgi:hypothetical protein
VPYFDLTVSAVKSPQIDAQVKARLTESTHILQEALATGVDPVAMLAGGYGTIRRITV